jgi:hypothetical protein
MMATVTIKHDSGHTTSMELTDESARLITSLAIKLALLDEAGWEFSHDTR